MGKKQLATTAGFDLFWEYAAKRQQIYWRQLAGQIDNLTDDPILANYRFTNNYRAADRVSQYLINRVQDDQRWNWPETFARTLLFKLFNRIDTWESLTNSLGEIRLADLMSERVDSVLGKLAAVRPIYNPAYIMPPPQIFAGQKFKRHLDLLRLMVNDGAGQKVKAAPSMRAAFGILSSYPSIGDFLAYQFIIDLNYSSRLDFSEDEFVIAGPGARRGLRKCFDYGSKADEPHLIRWLARQQDAEFAKRQLPWRNLWGRPLQLIDIQNICCELDKYTRLSTPRAGVPVTGKRPKQRYRPAQNAQYLAQFPNKWGLPTHSSAA